MPGKQDSEAVSRLGDKDVVIHPSCLARAGGCDEAAHMPGLPYAEGGQWPM